MSILRFENDYSAVIADIFANPNGYIITDTNVAKLIASKIKPKCSIFVLEAGEQSKNLECVQSIIADMYKSGCNRSTKVYAVGGGVVGDIAGFVSGIYMRGVEWSNIPTTLLSQVDSSIGGKTGVDFSGYKNLIGLFNEPSEVIICLGFLGTLSEDNWLSGLGEIIKTSFLDSGLYEMLQTDFEKIKKRDSTIMRGIIERCVSIKKRITDADLREKAARKALNLGHTIGHALETAEGFVRSHGEYVLWGLKYENSINRQHIDGNFYLKMQTMIARALLGKQPPSVDLNVITELCSMDKKNSDNLISIMVAENVGRIKEIKFKPKQLLKELRKEVTGAGL